MEEGTVVSRQDQLCACGMSRPYPGLRTVRWIQSLPRFSFAKNHFGPVVKDGFHTVLTPNTGLLSSQETIHHMVNRRERKV